MTSSPDPKGATDEEVERLSNAVERHAARVAAAKDDPGHYRILEARAAYIPVVYDETLPDFLLRAAAEVERIAATECRGSEGVSHMTVDWEMDEGWSACLVIE